MTIGTSYSTTVARSSESRSLERWTIRLTAKGATYSSGFASAYAALLSVICSRCPASADCGRVLTDGYAPRTPACHCAATRPGPEERNIGDASTGNASGPARTEGRATGVPFAGGDAR